jgi:hypothetical protein
MRMERDHFARVEELRRVCRSFFERGLARSRRLTLSSYPVKNDDQINVKNGTDVGLNRHGCVARERAFRAETITHSYRRLLSD